MAEPGTIMVKDINPGIDGSLASLFINLNGIVYFFAYNTLNGFALWMSDGTPAGTVIVQDVNDDGSSPGGLSNVNGTLFFSSFDPTNGNELWRSDGTTAGTVLRKISMWGLAAASLQN